MEIPITEPAAVRQAVIDSIQVGHVTTDLTVLVHRIATRRCCLGLAEDVAQTVLCNLCRNLTKINPTKDTYAYVCGGILNTWRRILRGRRRERRYLLVQMNKIISEIPPAYRGTARGKAVGSWERVSRLKYYA